MRRLWRRSLRADLGSSVDQAPVSARSVTVIGVHFTPETTGNAPYTAALASALVKEGWQVRVITGLPHYPAWRLMDEHYRSGSRWNQRTDEGVEVVRVRHHIPAKPDLAGRARMELTFLISALRVLRSDDSAIIIAVSPTLGGVAAAVLTRRKKPLGILVQDLTGNAIGQSGTAAGAIGSLVSTVEYRLYRRARRIGVITPRFGAVLSAHGVDAASLVDLPNFTHIDALPEVDRAEARLRLGWPADRVLVVHTGNMGMKQGLEFVVASARMAEKTDNKILFVLVGDGNQRAGLQEIAGACRNILFVDPLNERDYPLALAAADVLLVHERPGVEEMSLPSKVTSYVAAGRPIVAAVEPAGITGMFLAGSGAALCGAAGDAAALLDLVDTAMDPMVADSLVAAARGLHGGVYSRDAAEARYVGFANAVAGHESAS